MEAHNHIPSGLTAREKHEAWGDRMVRAQVKWPWGPGRGTASNLSPSLTGRRDASAGTGSERHTRRTMTVPRGQLREGHLGLLGKALKWLPKEGPCSQEEVWARERGL